MACRLRSRTDFLDLLVEARAEVTSLEEAAAAGDVTSLADTGVRSAGADPGARVAADHQRLPVIDQSIDADTPVDAFDEGLGTPGKEEDDG